MHTLVLQLTSKPFPFQTDSPRALPRLYAKPPEIGLNCSHTQACGTQGLLSGGSLRSNLVIHPSSILSYLDCLLSSPSSPHHRAYVHSLLFAMFCLVFTPHLYSICIPYSNQVNKHTDKATIMASFLLVKGNFLPPKLQCQKAQKWSAS